MAENNPGDAQNQPSPEPDPWATMPPVGGARPDNPYDTSGWAAPQASPFAAPDPAVPTPPPPPAAQVPQASPYASSSYPAAGQPPAGTGYPATPYSAQGPGTPWMQGVGAGGNRDANPIAALFDFSFTKFATPGLVKIVYILQVVAAVGVWLIWIISGFGVSRFGGGSAVGLVALFFGWIPVLLSIAFTRFVLEAIVALIRINDRVTEIAERAKEA